MVVRIPLTQGREALVSDEDADLATLKWFYMNSQGYGYVVRNNSSHKLVSLHRVVYERAHNVTLKRNETVEHIDGDRLNNQRENLTYRTWSLRQQRGKLLYAHNTSGYRGVSWDKSHGLWRVDLSVNNKTIYLGRYSTPREAALAYNDAALEYFGSEAQLNEV